MHCKELEFVLEAQGLEQLSKDARLHLATCGVCQGFVADLESIVSAAKSLPAEAAPPDRIWISLRAQLEAEGLIKEAVEVPERSSRWETFGAWLKPRTFAAATAVVLVLAVAVFLTRPPQTPHPDVAKNPSVIKIPRSVQPPTTTLASTPSTVPVIASSQKKADLLAAMMESGRGDD